jgi:mRNA interferase MazF
MPMRPRFRVGTNESGSGSRLDTFPVNPDPTVSREIRKTRPCVVVSPDEMNEEIGTVIVAPITTKGRAYPTRVECTFQGKRGRVVLDHIRAVDRVRLVRRLGKLSSATSGEVLAVLGETFAE